MSLAVSLFSELDSGYDSGGLSGVMDRRGFLAATVAVAAGTAAACTGPQIRGADHVGEWHYASLLDAADAVRSGQTSPTELTALMLARVSRLQSRLHAYTTVTEELAMRQAERAEREIRSGRYRGPLHGIPIAVKDLIRTKGIITTAGMPIHARYRPDYNATVMDRLECAGAILLGKLAMTEGAGGDHHPAFGPPPVNPWNTEHSPGASSSGPGVATAAGLCFGSLGSDTTGSIRYPAAANGVTGIKPTWGWVSRHGVFPLAESLDHVGPMARSAADAGALLCAIAGFDDKDPTTLTASVPDYLAQIGPRVDGLRVGIDVDYNETGAAPETVAMVRGAREVLESLGAVTKHVRIPDVSELIDAGFSSCAAEAAVAHQATYPARASEYGSLKELLDVGRAATGTEVMKAQQARLAFSGGLANLFTDIDVLLTPTQPPSNLTVDQMNRIWTTPQGRALMWRFTEPYNMSGNPTITLPGGFTPDGLPMTFQLVARHLGESLLIRTGYAYQQVTDWHHRHPAV